MKKRYIAPALEIASFYPEQIIATSGMRGWVHTDEQYDAEDALVKENFFEFSWE